MKRFKKEEYTYSRSSTYFWCTDVGFSQQIGCNWVIKEHEMLHVIVLRFDRVQTLPYFFTKSVYRCLRKFDFVFVAITWSRTLLRNIGNFCQFPQIHIVCLSSRARTKPVIW